MNNQHKYTRRDSPGAKRSTLPGAAHSAAAILTGAVLISASLLFSGQAMAFTPSAHVTFTLEGCRNDGTITLPIGGQFVCPDAAYTTGNLGKGWNELDLVPHRLTTTSGNQGTTTTDYDVYVAADYQTSGKTGYDVISAPAVNSSKSDASCTVTAAAELTQGTAANPFGGGTDVVRYRQLTIHQALNTTCVFDYYQRLALGSHLYPGSSLQSYMFDQTGLTGSKKTISIPVNEIQPQSLSKDMTATQNASHTWELQKGPTPANLSFGDVCQLGDPPYKLPVTIKVTWTKLAAGPTGNITVLTHVYATNPAARTITTNVTDVIYTGTTPLDTATSGDVAVPANTANFLLLTHTFSAPASTTNLNDIATATYTDPVTGAPVPGQTTATASANVQTGTTLNGTATVTDSESISGTGLTFAVDTPLIGLLDSSYTPGTFITGPLGWNSGLLSGSGDVEFFKTVKLETKSVVTNGTLSDAAELNGTDGFGPIPASASVGIDSSATVTMTVEKTIPSGILNSGDKMVVTFDVTRGADPSAHSPVILNFVGGGLTTLSDVVTGPPDTYTATETKCEFFKSGSSTAQSCGLVPDSVSKTVDLNLPTCANKVSFLNTVPAEAVAKVTVEKLTNPKTSAADPWEFTLNCTTPAISETNSTVTANDGPHAFEAALAADTTCTVTETLKTDWDLNSASPNDGSNTKVCSFAVDLPADAGKTFACSFTNTLRGEAGVVKTVSGQTPSGDQAFTFELRQNASTISDGTILETKVANAANGGKFNFTTKLVPGDHYQLCELVFPGWNTNLGVAGTLTGPLFVPNSIIPPNLPNPNVVNLPVCVDFIVGPGETKTADVDNAPPPGGRALTIGFWKNWSSCTIGHQAPLLDQMLAKAGGIIIGILDVDTCLKGVAILDKRDLNGKKQASDPAFNLAAQLLGYRLNIVAGAGTCSLAVNAATQAQTDLAQLKFNGLTHNNISKSLANTLNGLATTLDKFNNNNLCL